MRKELRGRRGITLIALVITIIVLLIFAGVSIATLTGDNGILTQAGKAKDETETKQLEEIVSVALTGLVTEKEGNRNEITPEMIADEVNRQEGRTDVTAEESTFPTYILFPKENKKVGVNLDLKIGAYDSYNGIYSEPKLEGKLAPKELFNYEIISEGETGATSIDNLPTKEAKIIGIKPEYCNKGGYNSETQNVDYIDTNYEIKYPGVTDTLVIPYQVEINGEMYKVTEVDLGIRYATEDLDESVQGTLPSIETIIYPNTVRRIFGSDHPTDVQSKLKKVVLPEKLTEIPRYMFRSCPLLEEIKIPNSVTSLGDEAFMNCVGLRSVTIPGNVISVGEYAFCHCDSLEVVSISDGVREIKDSAFDSCNSLIKVSIPGSVQSLGSQVFGRCGNLTEITISEGVTYLGDSAFCYCDNLSKVTLPESVTSIENETFRGCSKLAEITIPGSVTSIGDGAFKGCNSLTKITIPESVTRIGNYAFSICNSLKEINIKKTEGSITGAPWTYDWTTNQPTVNWNYTGE